MLKCFQTDLHIHTCLSPCADLTMSPKRIVEQAMAKKLDIIAICDHNSAENVHAAKNAASKSDVRVLAGMEVTSAEEVHLLALFDKTKRLLNLQETVYANLTPGENKEELFGEQIIADEFDEVKGYNKRLLIGATNLTLKELVNKIHELGGLAIASHIDRETYSIIGQLGFIPEDLELDALEISPNSNRNDALSKFPEIKKFPLIFSSDAHFLKDIGRVTTSFLLEEPTVDEIRKALENRDGRKVII
ncbi:PHP domain-containing protein [candidate division WOR-3 bacterium]|jgi:predicted metal-dependent phosphoesterase TrpH|nr:PHP domain-containing protein [candidate division WOR-3 bacterium]